MRREPPVSRLHALLMNGATVPRPDDPARMANLRSPTLGGSSGGGREDRARDVARGVGPREARRRPPPSRRSRSRIEQDRVDLRAQPLGRQLGVGEHDRGAALAPSSARWRSGGRRWRAGTGRAPPAAPYWASSKIEPPARATARSAAASAWPNGVDVVAQVVVRARARSGRRSRAGRRRAARGRARRRTPATAASLIERAPSEPPKTSTQRSSAPMPERGAGRLALGVARRHRAAGDEVALAVAAGDREREADAPRARREQPVAEAQVRVGLGQHERDAPQHRGEPDRPGDVAAAAEHRVGAAVGAGCAPAARSASAALPAARSGLQRVACARCPRRGSGRARSRPRGRARPPPAARRRTRPPRPQPAARRPPRWPARRARPSRRPRSRSAVRSRLPFSRRPAHGAQVRRAAAGDVEQQAHRRSAARSASVEPDEMNGSGTPVSGASPSTV